jgi:hypothetical protein
MPPSLQKTGLFSARQYRSTNCPYHLPCHNAVQVTGAAPYAAQHGPGMLVSCFRPYHLNRQDWKDRLQKDFRRMPLVPNVIKGENEDKDYASKKYT